MNLLCLYPCFANLFSNSSCAILPACGKPYIPHSLPHLDVHIFFRCCLIEEVVFFDDVVGDVAYFEPHIFVSCEWSVEVEVFDIHREELCSIR